MVIAKIKVDGVSAVATELSQIPKGIQGATIEVTYDASWGSLKKTAVFSGSTVKDVVNAGAVISVPPETVAKSGHRLRVGFYGVDGENKVIMPTLWVDLGAIQSAADPSGDTSTNQSLPVWAQLQAEFEALKEAGGIKGEKGDKGDPGPAGPQGEPGQPGADGKDYILTEADKSEIAGIAAGMVEVPEAPEVSMKPLTFTGAVNATYDGSEAVSVEIPQGGGGGGEVRTVKDVVLASGTIPAGTAKTGNPPNCFDTGLTVADLQKYKVFRMQLGCVSKAPGYIGFTISNMWVIYLSTKGYSAFFEWADTAKTAFYPLTVWNSIGQNMIVHAAVRATYIVDTSAPSSVAYHSMFKVDSPNSKVGIYFSGDLTEDMKWQIRGVIE